MNDDTVLGCLIFVIMTVVFLLAIALLPGGYW